MDRDVGIGIQVEQKTVNVLVEKNATLKRIPEHSTQSDHGHRREAV
jgi:hypothetical protein